MYSTLCIGSLDVIEPVTPTREDIISYWQKHIMRVHLEAMKTLRALKDWSEVEDCSEVLPHLYLGNGISFLNTTFAADVYLDLDKVPFVAADEIVYMPDREVGVGRIFTDNPMRFKQVITACPIQRIDEAFLTDPLLTKSLIIKNYMERRMDWWYIGEQMKDAKESDPPETKELYWSCIVHDSSVDATNRLRKSYRYERDAKDREKTEKIMKNKQEALAKIPVKEWFSPTFLRLDRAFFGGERTLIHCIEGRSRSVAILAAYLINRFSLTTDQAILFLRSKRLCAASKFVDNLRSYEALLRR